jgi:hypothetical protein
MSFLKYFNYLLFGHLSYVFSISQDSTRLNEPYITSFLESATKKTRDLRELDVLAHFIGKGKAKVKQSHYWPGQAHKFQGG